MLRITVLALAFIVAALSAAVWTQEGEPGVRITLEHDSKRERSTAEQLRDVLAAYDVAQWVSTHHVRIYEGTVPHSHPVLTLHTRHLGNDMALLAVFLHEQFHWLEERNASFREAIDAFEDAYPEAPIGGPKGAGDMKSTYRHLLICDLEYQAMSLLVGEERAREVLSANQHYTWIYDRVLNDPKVREITSEHGFLLSGPDVITPGS